MENKILREILEELEKGKSSALITLTDISGTNPGRIGSLMGVFDDGTVLGTVGGGKVEYEIIELANKSIRDGLHRNFSFDIVDDNGVVCGGKTTGFIKAFVPKNKLVIFGSGHVGRQVAWVVNKLPFQVYVIDDRLENKNLDELKYIKEYLDGSIEDSIKRIDFDKNTYCLLASRNHVLDRQALKTIIDKDVAYIGMIGSKKKILGIFKNLEDSGVNKELLGKVHTPVGIKVDNGSPEEIAFSIISQILMIKNNCHGEDLKIKL